MQISVLMHLSTSLVALCVSSARSRLSCRYATFCASSSSGRRKNKEEKVSTHNNTKQKRANAGEGRSGPFWCRKEDELWTCVQGCRACCKLDKGPEFGTPEEISDDPADVQLFQSMVGSDGWCINCEKATRRMLHL